MQLNKEHWTKRDGEEFKKYLLSFSKGKEKGEWEKKIVNTNLPCIAVDSKIIKEIVREIAKGNFLEFLDLDIRDNFSLVSVNGGLITKIKDFDLMVSYLDAFVSRADNWASIDTLKHNITTKNQDKFMSLAKRYVLSDKTFVRRAGILILFKFVKTEYLPEVIKIIESFESEEEYYVNMALAWLVAEIFIKNREEGLKLFERGKLNDFTINKAVQKCRDSFRVSSEDKEMLTKFKRSKNGQKN